MNEYNIMINTKSVLPWKEPNSANITASHSAGFQLTYFKTADEKKLSKKCERELMKYIRIIDLFRNVTYATQINDINVYFFYFFEGF